MSLSDISVPIDISAAAFRTASRSSGSMVSNAVVAAFVRKPEFKVHQCQKVDRASTPDLPIACTTFA